MNRKLAGICTVLMFGIGLCFAPCETRSDNTEQSCVATGLFGEGCANVSCTQTVWDEDIFCILTPLATGTICETGGLNQEPHSIHGLQYSGTCGFGNSVSCYCRHISGTPVDVTSGMVYTKVTRTCGGG